MSFPNLILAISILKKDILPTLKNSFYMMSYILIKLGMALRSIPSSGSRPLLGICLSCCYLFKEASMCHFWIIYLQSCFTLFISKVSRYANAMLNRLCDMFAIIMAILILILKKLNDIYYKNSESFFQCIYT